MLVGAFGTPDDSSGSTGRVETGVGFVTFVGITELPVDLGGCFCDFQLVDGLKSKSLARNGHGSKRKEILHTTRARFVRAESPDACLERISGDARLAVYGEFAVIERHGWFLIWNVLII